MAITLGMKDLLSAKRLRFFSDTGAWKRTVIRYFLFGEPTLEYPVTLTQSHPDLMVVADRDSVLPPLGD
jgi:glucosamine-6-phosphate deaminase